LDHRAAIEIKRLDREIEQEAFINPLLADAETALAKAPSGSGSVIRLSAAIRTVSDKVKTEGERERLSSLAPDLSQITARFPRGHSLLRCLRRLRLGDWQCTHCAKGSSSLSVP
jgi:hypothetical protein